MKKKAKSTSIMYDIEGNIVEYHNLQDKGPWYQHGIEKENVFVSKFGEQLNIGINPEKEHNVYAPDLIQGTSIGDLKTVNTPFFAASLYKLDPQFTVTFNTTDRRDYKGKELDIYFWVEWLPIRRVTTYEDGREYVTRVNPMHGVWYIPFSQLDKILESADIHEYKERVGDTNGNATHSYVLDLRNPAFQQIL
ncbi:hypothetical protein [Paenibacillus sp. MMO-58]|uniref:hypothetical protein n=1 Tax=Paenibacillus sp. MMO-58 TaxID=3081290 RepID=UPI0030186754